MTVPDTVKVSPAWLGLPIAVWMLHFLVSYVVAAVHCARAPSVFAPLAEVRWSIAFATILASLVLLSFARRGHRSCGGRYFTRRSPDGTHAFLGALLVLLCALGLFGVLAVAAVGVFFGDCRQ